MRVLSDEAWSVLAPMIEACRPKGKRVPQDLRRTIEAIVWRCQNGAKWRSVPSELGPWHRAAQLFIRWSKLGAWERLLTMAQDKGIRLGMVHMDGTVIRAHAKAAGARKPNPQPKVRASEKGDLDEADAERIKRLAALAEAMAPRLALSAMAPAGPLPSRSAPDRRTS